MQDNQPVFRHNPATGQIEEAVYQAADDSSYQTNFDQAQENVTNATATVNAAESAYAEAAHAVENTSLALEDARKILEAAQVELSFQDSRKTAYGEAVRLRDELAVATPETEFADELDDETEASDTDTGSESTEVPITVLA